MAIRELTAAGRSTARSRGVVLVNPCQLQAGYWRSAAPPLGLAYLAASLEAAEIPVRIVDMEVEGVNESRLLELLKAHSPVFVGMPVTLFTLRRCVALAERIRQEIPGLRVVVGGPYATLHPQRVLSASAAFDILLRGEAEHTIVELHRALLAGAAPSRVEGACMRHGDELVISNQIARVAELDSLPFPAHHLLPLGRYFDASAGTSALAGMVTSRGCPFSCSFCATGLVSGRRFRTRSAVNVLAEVEHLVRQHGVRHVVFWDDTFTLDRERVLELCAGLRARPDLELGFRIRSRVDCVDAELIRELAASGCTLISYGIESGSQAILDAVRKGTTLAQAEEALRLTREAGMRSVAYFMIGNAGETRASVTATVDFAIRVRPDYAIFTIATPIPGTGFAEMVAREASEHLFWELEELDSWHRKPLASLSVLDGVSVLELQRQAYRRFYFRPRYVLEYLRSAPRRELAGHLKAFVQLLGSGIFALPTLS